MLHHHRLMRIDTWDYLYVTLLERTTRRFSTFAFSDPVPISVLEDLTKTTGKPNVYLALLSAHWMEI